MIPVQPARLELLALLAPQVQLGRRELLGRKEPRETPEPRARLVQPGQLDCKGLQAQWGQSVRKDQKATQEQLAQWELRVRPVLRGPLAQWALWVRKVPKDQLETLVPPAWPDLLAQRGRLDQLDPKVRRGLQAQVLMGGRNS